MFDTQLFLGFPISDSYRLELSRLPPSEVNLFIQAQDSSYLQKIENEGVEYLGKYLGPSIEIKELEMSHSHIYSLLKKLVSHFPYDQFSLFLLALPNSTHSLDVTACSKSFNVSD